MTDPDPAELYRLLVAKVRTAVDQIEALMLSDVWDSIPTDRQRALTDVVEQMRAHLAPTEGALGEPFSDED